MAHAQRVRLVLSATPGARQERLSVDAHGTLRVAVRARATEGAANRAVCRAIAAWLDLPPSAVTIVRGAAARQKVVEIVGLAPEDLAERLAALHASPIAPPAASRGEPAAK